VGVLLNNLVIIGIVIAVGLVIGLVILSQTHTPTSIIKPPVKPPYKYEVKCYDMCYSLSKNYSTKGYDPRFLALPEVKSTCTDGIRDGATLGFCYVLNGI